MMSIDRLWLAPSRLVNEISWTLSLLSQGVKKRNHNDFVTLETILYQYALEQFQNHLTARSIPKIER